MKKLFAPIFIGIFLLAGFLRVAEPFARADWGAPLVKVSHANGKWTIAGEKQIVSLDEKTFTLEVNAQSVIWKMFPSGTNDLIVKFRGEEFPLQLTDAKKFSVEPYDTGFKTGIKIILNNWQHGSDNFDLPLYLTIGLQGNDEDLVFDIVAQEGDAILRQLDWPEALDARDVDYTVLSNNKGDLLPRNWPKPYFPIRSTNPDGSAKISDHSILQSHVIEDWSMSWWLNGLQIGWLKSKTVCPTAHSGASGSWAAFFWCAGEFTITNKNSLMTRPIKSFIKPHWKKTRMDFGFTVIL